MTDHHVFDSFSPVESETTGDHVYDYLGGATRAAYKRAWAKYPLPPGRTFRPARPPKNEHYFDWIALLRTIDRANGAYRMAELGAGWAPWLVRAALAARQRPAITSLELLAVEADPAHYAWIAQHFRDNGVDPSQHHILHGAAAGAAGVLRFPVIDDPDVDYGSGIGKGRTAARTIEVQAYALPELLDRFSGPVDFLHVDIQGAEYETLPPAMELLGAKVKSIMIGTHMSDDLHAGLVQAFRAAGWTELFALCRNQKHATPWGDIEINDGFLLYDNPRLL